MAVVSLFLSMECVFHGKSMALPVKRRCSGGAHVDAINFDFLVFLDRIANVNEFATLT